MEKLYHEPQWGTSSGNTELSAGFTPLPDVLLDYWLPELSGAEAKVVLYIARRTYGFQKTSDEISVSQMVEGIKKRDGMILDRGTGLGRASVIRAVRSLVDRGLLMKVRNYDKRRGDTANTYRLTIQQPCHRKDEPAEENHFTGGSQNDTPRVPKVDTQETVRQKTDTSPRGAEAPQKEKESSGKKTMDKLIGDLATKGYELSHTVRGKYGAIFRELIEKGQTASEVSEIVSHITSRWPDKQLLPNEALRELRDEGEKQSATPSEGVEYIRNYTSSGRAPGDRVGPSIAKGRENFAKVAEDFDFTSDEEPPMKIRLRISKYPQECDEIIVRLRSMTRRAVREAKGESREAALAKMGPFNDAESPATPSRMDSAGLEDGPEESSTTPQPAEGNERPALNWTDGWDDDLIPVGVSEEVQKAAAVLQDTDQDAGKVFRRVLDGRLTQEQAVEAAVWAVYGTFEPAGGTGKIGVVVEDLRYLLAAERKRATA